VLVFVGIFGLFWASFLLRTRLVEQYDTFASLYDRGAHVGEASLWIGVVILAVWLCVTASRHASNEVVRKNELVDVGSNQGVAALPLLLALMPFLLVYFFTRESSYEEQHKFINENPVGKTFYLTYLYFAILIAEGMVGKFRQRRRTIEFAVLALTISLTVPLRSFIIADFFIILIFGRVRLLPAVMIVAALIGGFVVMAVIRSGGSLKDVDTLALNLAMLGGGPSTQIDLYFLAKENGFATASNFADALGSMFSDFFVEGGGFGSFLPLELAFMLPDVYLPALAAFLLLASYSVRSRSILVRAALVCMGTLSISILRNPLSSWTKGYVVLVALVVFHVSRHSHRSAHL